MRSQSIISMNKCYKSYKSFILAWILCVFFVLTDIYENFTLIKSSFERRTDAEIADIKPINIHIKWRKFNDKNEFH